MADTLTATLTQGMSGTEAKTILDSLGIDVSGVLSSSNIAQTTSGKTTDTSDLLGIRSDIYSNLGVSEKQAAYQKALEASQKATQNLSTGLQQLSARPVSLSKITGQQAQLREVSANEISALEDAATLALQNYQAVKSEADTQFEIRNQQLSETKALMVQYPGAGIKFSDSTEKQVKKLSDYQKELEKETYKKELKKMAMELGLKTSGSRKELEKRISKYNKSALDDAKRSAELDYDYKKIQIDNVKSEIANRGKSSGSKEESKQEAAFWKDIETQQNKMSSGKTNWSSAFNHISNKYSGLGLTVDAIDSALGYDYRDEYDVSLSELNY